MGYIYIILNKNNCYSSSPDFLPNRLSEYDTTLSQGWGWVLRE